MIIAIVGKTSSGKDSLAKYIKEYYDIPAIVSYTTRPKRESETNGIEHWFISKEEMAELLKTENIIAYTKNDITGIEYCAIEDKSLGKDFVYIINPEGIKWFEENNSSTELYSIYVDLDEESIIARGNLRGDDPAVLSKRLYSERDEFDNFKNSNLYDYLLVNDKDLVHLHQAADCFLNALGLRKKV